MKLLFLIPTPMERADLAPLLHVSQAHVELCGFGVAAAGARAGQLIELHQADLVVLLGIAGSYQSNLTPGKAYAFNRVWCDGIGVGEADGFQSAGEMGWPHWQMVGDEPVGDEIEIGSDSSGHGLLTVCAASADSAQAQSRRERYPHAAAEDMEGFSVAVACRIANVPLQIIRGISNVAGNREHATWKVHEAIESVAEMVNQRFAQESSS